ncbi:MAG: rod shape-determining protein MreD [Bacteroidia bacterium]
MINEVARNTARFFVFMLIQVLILKHIDLSRFINPFLYVIFILMLPIRTDKALVMMLAFIAGLTIDMFYNTMGYNAAACVFMAYCRPWVLGMYAPKGEYDASAKPTMQSLGLPWMLSYAGTLVFIHHFTLFFLEALSFSAFFSTLGIVIISGITTVGLVILSQLIMQRRRT